MNNLIKLTKSHQLRVNISLLVAAIGLILYIDKGELFPISRESLYALIALFFIAYITLLFQFDSLYKKLKKGEKSLKNAREDIKSYQADIETKTKELSKKTKELNDEENKNLLLNQENKDLQNEIEQRKKLVNHIMIMKESQIDFIITKLKLNSSKSNQKCATKVNEISLGIEHCTRKIIQECEREILLYEFAESDKRLKKTQEDIKNNLIKDD